MLPQMHGCTPRTTFYTQHINVVYIRVHFFFIFFFLLQCCFYVRHTSSKTTFTLRTHCYIIGFVFSFSLHSRSAFLLVTFGTSSLPRPFRWKSRCLFSLPVNNSRMQRMIRVKWCWCVLNLSVATRLTNDMKAKQQQQQLKTSTFCLISVWMNDVKVKRTEIIAYCGFVYYSPNSVFNSVSF